EPKASAYHTRRRLPLEGPFVDLGHPDHSLVAKTYSVLVVIGDDDTPRLLVARRIAGWFARDATLCWSVSRCNTIVIPMKCQSISLYWKGTKLPPTTNAARL